MKITVNGQIFPKVWGIAKNIKKLRNERRQINIGGGTVGFPIYEVELPDDTKKDGLYLLTPQGIRLYYFPGDQYRIGYLISELDNDPIRDRHFAGPAQKKAS